MTGKGTSNMKSYNKIFGYIFILIILYSVTYLRTYSQIQKENILVKSTELKNSEQSNRLYDQHKINEIEKKAGLKGKYFNHSYGFSVFIPDGLEGQYYPMVNPQHGVTIDLSEDGISSVLVWGYYQRSINHDPLRDEFEFEYNQINKQYKEINLISYSKTRLSKFLAIHFVIKYKNEKDSNIIKDCFIIKNKNNEILYNLELETPDIHYRNHKKIFLKIVKSWKPESIR